MKKQFFRVKQLADQTFLRADKSEVLNHEELQIADHKVEYLRSALTAISKKVPSASSEKADVEKRMKKFSEYHLGVTLLEQSVRKRDPEQISRVEDDCTLFPTILKECGQVEQDLAKEQAEHEIKVEQMVSAPIQAVLDNDLPNILKHKRTLSKYILDKDSANNRYNATKKETVKEDLDEADIKVEQSRDLLAYEMFKLLKRENELSQYILQLLKLQRGYHESALKNLETVIPQLERRISDSSVKAIFGINLEQHLRITGRRIAFPLELCVCALSELGMQEEGLLRVAGGANRVKRLKVSLDSGCFKFPLIPEYRDVHVIASTLKSYLRDLPEPLLTFELYHEWMGLAACPEGQRVKYVQDLVKKLPTANRDNLSYLIHFLAKLTKHRENNKMNASNIAIVIAPNLLWGMNQHTEMGNMNDCSTSNLIAELLINNVNLLFPDDPGLYLTLTKDMLFNEEEFHRPVLQNVRLTDLDADQTHNHEVVAESPRPQIRRKTKPAPVPPSMASKQEMETSSDHRPSYPSGSSTLNRSQRKGQTSVGVNTEDGVVGNAKRQSLVLDETHPSLVNLDDKIVEQKQVSSPPPPAAIVQVSKVQTKPPPAQSFFTEAVFTTSGHGFVEGKPVAAPRSINTEGSLSRSASVRTSDSNVMSKSLNSIEGDDVHLRKSDHARPKPEVPVRPASLRAAPRTSIDEGLHRTQCSVYSINKHQPSIVNIHKPGHDVQITEKEKFLGHQPEKSPRPSLENRFGDVNSNCASNRTRTSSVGNNSNRAETSPSSAKVAKSNEKLNSSDASETTNGNHQKPSHARTRSDGNIIDLGGDGGFQNTLPRSTPSPRHISKPSFPPPPPPVAGKSKTDGDSTDL